MPDRLEPPTREQVRRKLRDLAEGRAMPDEVADWAVKWVVMDDPDIDDPVVWRAVDLLAGADLLTIGGSYLHGETDFLDWLAWFDRASGAE